MASLKFTKSHEWLKIDGDLATVGITDYAQKELGDIVFIELPQVGESYEESVQFGTVESTKAASELYMPLGGEIVAINDHLNAHPQLLNEDPTDKGWIVKIKIKNVSDEASLMDQEAYSDFVAKEAD